MQLRLAEASTLEQANQVLASDLPRFNAQFAVAPAQQGSAYRPMQETLQAEDLFFASSIRGSWRQTTPSVSPSNASNCFRMRSVAVMPGYASRCTSTSMGICRSTLPDTASQRPRRRWRLPRCELAQDLGGNRASVHSQTPSSAVALLTQASTAELGESTGHQAEQSTGPRRPASTHPWRKPLLKPKRTKSLDNNTVSYPMRIKRADTDRREKDVLWTHFLFWNAKKAQQISIFFAVVVSEFFLCPIEHGVGPLFTRWCGKNDVQ